MLALAIKFMNSLKPIKWAFLSLVIALALFFGIPTGSVIGEVVEGPERTYIYVPSRWSTHNYFYYIKVKLNTGEVVKVTSTNPIETGSYRKVKLKKYFSILKLRNRYTLH
jgi:hypothetical protein